MRQEERKTGKTPKVLVYIHSKKGTEDVQQKLDKIFNEDNEQPDQRKITVSMHRLSNAVLAAAHEDVITACTETPPLECAPCAGWPLPRYKFLSTPEDGGHLR